MKKQIEPRSFRQRVEIQVFKLKLRAKLKKEPIELLYATKEEINRELEIRNKSTIKGQ